jgi:hypothetical protein
MGKVGDNIFRWLFGWVFRLIDIKNAAWFCRGVAIFHLVLCIVFIGITGSQASGQIDIPRLVTPITATMGAWIPSVNFTEVGADDSYISSISSCPLHSPHSRMERFFVKQYAISVGEVDTRVLIIMFHFLSFLFQYLGALDKDFYENELRNGRVHIGHYFEYSISASIMMIAVCAQLGVTDIFLIINIVMNCFSCMIFGVIAEVCFSFRKIIYITYGTRGEASRLNIHWLAHATGWVVLLFGTITGALSNLILNFHCVNSNGSKIPEWVMGLVFAEVVLFSCFGFVQLLSFWKRAKYGDMLDRLGKDQGVDLEKERTRQLIVDSAVNTEFAYIILSALAKTILGFGVFMGNLANN